MHCISDKFTIGMLLVEKNSINITPEYQRESAIWSTEKQQLFLDSLLNKYDIPKLYMNDLRGKDPRYQFAVIDGKQRLHTIWQFLDNEIKLAEDFSLSQSNGKPFPKKNDYFKDISETWQERFKAIGIDVVLVQNAEEDDIEELFSRLNNGEPLNAAEKRNAMGGDMCKLIREISNEPFFKKKVKIPNKRYQHYEASAKFLLFEKTEMDSGQIFCDIKKRFLDKLVKGNKKMQGVSRKGLLDRIKKRLSTVSRVFSNKDALLNRQAYLPLYYLFIKAIDKEYSKDGFFSSIKKFLQDFHVLRMKNLEKPEDERNLILIEFGRLMQQGTNDLNSLAQRASILKRFYLLDNPDVKIKDKKRIFSKEERLAIFILSGQQCAMCEKEFDDINEMQSDHKEQWAKGGPTTLENGRALCESCNKESAKKRT